MVRSDDFLISHRFLGLNLLVNLHTSGSILNKFFANVIVRKAEVRIASFHTKLLLIIWAELLPLLF